MTALAVDHFPMHRYGESNRHDQAERDGHAAEQTRAFDLPPHDQTRKTPEDHAREHGIHRDRPKPPRVHFEGIAVGCMQTQQIRTPREISRVVAHDNQIAAGGDTRARVNFARGRG